LFVIDINVYKLQSFGNFLNLVVLIIIIILIATLVGTLDNATPSCVAPKLLFKRSVNFLQTLRF
jgi:hypothetical protein